MDTLLEYEGRRYLVGEASSENFNAEGLGRFACLLWEHGPTLTPMAERAAIAARVLRAGCRYVACGGVECEKWEASFDEEFVAQTYMLEEAGMDARHVMTTSHPDESVDEIAFFFAKLTTLDDWEPSEFVLLHAGVGPDREAVELRIRANLLNASDLRG